MSDGQLAHFHKDVRLIDIVDTQWSHETIPKERINIAPEHDVSLFEFEDQDDDPKRNEDKWLDNGMHLQSVPAANKAHQ
eukprot:m.46600 g.46600  ORF g.46600 m.46600 type:complete len:79 (+) comp13158_c0_seq2:136-372(+)